MLAERADSMGEAGGGGASAPSGEVHVYKAVSEKTATSIFSCIKQRIDRAAAVAALEAQVPVRAGSLCDKS